MHVLYNDCLDKYSLLALLHMMCYSVISQSNVMSFLSILQKIFYFKKWFTARMGIRFIGLSHVIALNKLDIVFSVIVKTLSYFLV